jgi:hypothetical protein
VLKGLADTGFVDGRNVMIEYRWVVPAILRDLIERRVAVLLDGWLPMSDRRLRLSDRCLRRGGPDWVSL